MRISFLLPSDNRSGGVRVTAIMAELLRNNGHEVRIVCIQKQTLLQKFKRFRKTSAAEEKENTGWLYQFSGEIVYQSNPRHLKTSLGEVVISVGSYTIEYLNTIDQDVIKLRYNHGLPAIFDAEAEQVWSYQMPSITVSQTIVDRLNELCPNSVLGVVPNGIDGKVYCNMKLERNGIGVFYSVHPNKAPDFIVQVMQEIHTRWPDIPLYVISTQAIPAELEEIANYLRYPPVEKVCETYNKCRCWLLPSDTEGLPGPVLESMSCGTVVVSTDNVGSLEIISPEVNGLISERRNLGEFVANVERAYFDEELNKKLSLAGSQRADEFSWEQALKKMEVILTGLSESDGATNSK